MMGFLPETSRLRNPVTLVVILLACMAFLGYTYWFEYNRSVVYRNRVAFLERYISKVSKVEEEDDGREEDFQKELRRQGQRMQQMNAMARQEMEKLSRSCQMEKDQLLRAIESKSSVIRDKEELISHMMAEQQKLDKELKDFESNQSQVMEKYSLLAAKVEPLIKLKETCYAQLASINRGSAASAGSQRAEEKVPKESQSGTNGVDDKKGIVPVAPPAAKLPAPSPVIRVPSVRPQVENLPKNIPINSVPKEVLSGANEEDDKKGAVPVVPPAAKIPAPSPVRREPMVPLQLGNLPKNIPVNSVPKVDESEAEDEKRGALSVGPAAAKLPQPQSSALSAPIDRRPAENPPKDLSVNSVKVSDIIIQTLKKTTPSSRKVEEEDQEPMGGDAKKPVDQKQPAITPVDKMDNAIPKDQEEDNVVEEEKEGEILLD